MHAGVDIGLPEPVHCPPDKARKVLDTLKPGKLVLAHMGGWKQWEEVYEYLAGEPVYLDTAFSFDYMSQDMFMKLFLFIRRLPTKALAVLAVLLGITHAWFFIGNVSGYDMIGVGWTIDEVNFWGGLVRMLFPFTMGMLIARTFKPRKVKGAFWICSAMLIVLFSVPYIATESSISLNSLYEVICIALIFPFIVWMGACGSCGENTL